MRRTRCAWPLRLAALAASLAALSSAGCTAVLTPVGLLSSPVRGVRAEMEYCDRVDEFVIGWRNRVWANQAWEARAYRFAGHPHLDHFGQGFRAGYRDVAGGANGCPPALPPRKYWSWRYQTAEGQAKVASWFEGYPYGAAAAEEDGAGAHSQIQVSHPIEVQYGERALGLHPGPAVPPGHASPGFPAMQGTVGPAEVLPPGAPQPWPREPDPSLAPPMSPPVAPAIELPLPSDPAASPSLMWDGGWQTSPPFLGQVSPCIYAQPQDVAPQAPYPPSSSHSFTPSRSHSVLFASAPAPFEQLPHRLPALEESVVGDEESLKTKSRSNSPSFLPLAIHQPVPSHDWDAE